MGCGAGECSGEAIGGDVGDEGGGEGAGQFGVLEMEEGDEALALKKDGEGGGLDGDADV